MYNYEYIQNLSLFLLDISQNGSNRVCYIILSGLFALLASCSTHLFEGVASVSGSFWYDKFTEWFSTQEYNSSRYYFSLGEKEKDGKDPRLAVEEETAKIMSTLQTNEKDVIFEYNEGNHFRPLIERVEKATSALIAA